MINQFNQIKKFASNYAFRKDINNPEQIICTEITSDIIEEMRKERKINMCINKAGKVKEYISVDIESTKIMDKDKMSQAQI